MVQSISSPVQLQLNLDIFDHARIPLGQGIYSLVDRQDYEWALQWKWSILKPWKDSRYGVRGQTEDGETKRILLHRSLMERIVGRSLVFSEKIDHINGDGLDNRRSNLRVATNSQNGMNRGRQVDNSTGFKGVYYHKEDNRWQARIKVNQKQISLGQYGTPAEAAMAYDRAALWYHREFAYLNFDRSYYGEPEEPKRPLLRSHNSTGYKGVVLYKQGVEGRWCAQITVKRKIIHLGTYTDIIEAAKAYDHAAITHFGPDWPINFPEDYIVKEV